MSTPGTPPPDDDRFGADLGASLRHHVAADPHHADLLAGSLYRAHRIRRRRLTTGIVAAALAVVLGLGAGALATFLPGNAAGHQPPIAGSPTPSTQPSAVPSGSSPYAVTLSTDLPSGTPPDIEWLDHDVWHGPSGQTAALADTTRFRTGWGGSPISTAAGVFTPRITADNIVGYSVGAGAPVRVGKQDNSMGTPFAYNGGVVWPRQAGGYVYVDAQGRRHDWPAFGQGWTATAGTTRYLWGTRNGAVGRFNPATLTDSTVVSGYTAVVAGDPVSNLVVLQRADGCNAVLDAQSLRPVLARTCTTFAAISADGRYYAGTEPNGPGDVVQVIDLTTGDTVATITGVAPRQDHNAVFDTGDRLVVIAMSKNAASTALVTVDFLHGSATSATPWTASDASALAIVTPNNRQGATAPESQQSPPPAGPTAPTTPPPSTPAACTAAGTTVVVKPAKGGGAAGSYAYDLIVTNTGSSPCTLNGFPGVSMVMGDNGTQLGAAADRTGKASTTVTVQPGDTTTTTLLVSQAGNYGAACASHQARGFRIYLPGERSAQFAKADVTGCTNQAIHLLTIRAFGS